MTPVDVAVVGGGLQGLVLLRELTAAGYTSLLITNADLGSGQTLHSHGLLNSGTGLLTGVLEAELHESTVPYLRRLGVPTYGQDRSFLLLPDAVVDQLTPLWEANDYHPRRTDQASLPPGFEAVGAVYRVEGVHVDKRRLVGAVAAGLEPFIVRGRVVDASDTLLVRTHPSGDVVSLEPRAVVVAAGCGTKRLLGQVFGVPSPVLDRITFNKVHMLCLRGPAGLLPDVGTVLSPELILVGHPSADRSLVTWYVSPATPAAPRHAEAPDNGAADVEPSVVTAGIQALLRLYPPLAHDDGRIQATVFAGYKQDLDGQSTLRTCEVVDDERNVVMALPSVLANAVPNAVDALMLLRERVEPTNARPELRPDGDVTVGRLNEDADDMWWSDWSEFADS